MSLYIGNLSEHSRRDELERVFRRFGQCNVQLKRDGYGFVVFDFPPNAEKALRALKGRNICGEQLSLTWSNKQPNTQLSRRGARRNANGLQHGTERIARRKTGFGVWSNQKMGRGNSVDMPDEQRGNRHDNFRDYVEKEKDYGGDLFVEGSGVNPEENDRWGEPVHNPSVDNRNGNAIEFDRYEPYQKYDNEDYHVGYSGGSPAVNSQENVNRAHIGEGTSNCPNGSKFQQTCFRCGDPGHKMRNCPKEHSSQWRYNSLGFRQNNRIDKNHEDENKFGYSSREKLQSSRDALPMKHQRGGRRLSVTRENDKHQRKEDVRNKRGRNELKLSKRSKAKMCKRSVSTSLSSDYSASHSLSNSQSSKSLHKSSSRSRSRLLSSRSHSSSSKLKSSSKAQYRKGKSLNSRRSTSLMSLSVSLNKPLSSPNKIQLNSKNTSINGTAVETVDHLNAQGQQIGGSKMVLKNPQSGGSKMELENPQSGGSKMELENPQSGGSKMELENPQSGGSKMELKNPQSKDTDVINGKTADVYNTVVDIVGKSQLVQEDNHENHIFLKSSDRVTDLNEPPVENLSRVVVKDTEVLRRSGTQVSDATPETNVNLHSDLSTIISVEEMHTVLNYYGLKLPKDDENNLTIDALFGCARLWPWHLVYYRRLKKGPISTENYARRIAQNQEFGIIDKYIRSSSGWGEIGLGNS